MIVKETQGYPTGYLRASSDTIQHGLESREVGYETAITLHGLWILRFRGGDRERSSTRRWQLRDSASTEREMKPCFVWRKQSDRLAMPEAADHGTKPSLNEGGV